MGLKIFICLGLFCVTSVLGFGIDPALCINVFDELTLGDGFDGVTQVQGFHSESRAFHFQGSSREVKAPEDVSERMLQKLRGRREFTVVVTLKQEHFNSGVILSIHHSEQRFLELESSGQRNEVRLHYRTKGQKAHTEVFPYSLADGQWHKVSVAVSASHIILHVDCNRIYERVVEIPFMDIPEDTTFWLGQRSSTHGFFKGVMQDVQILVMPQGFISQCPDLNRTCPTCNDFHGLVQKIMELQDILAKTSSKLSRAEEMMNGLDGCYCERTCSVKGVVYREDESLTDGCRNCTCTNGTVQCETISCPPPQCPADTTPAYVKGACCMECQPVCHFGEEELVEGDQKAVHYNSGRCQLSECRERTMHRVVMTSPCPELNCPESEQITLTDRCCKVCRGHDFCAEGHGCVEHSDCINLEAGACCSCKDGFRPLRDDNAYCEDIDECAEGKHYCRENTMCVNTAGSFMCVCHTGYIRIDDYCCTEHDECVSGLHSCAQNALCFNTVGGHSCSCKPGYTGNGTICKAMCDGLCQNGGTCISPNNCICQLGFTGKMCETDIDECFHGFVECDDKAICVNLPGWYHCECRDGYHDNGLFSTNGESCIDINECKTGRNTCANDTVCFNLEGGYDCRCPHGRNCTGDCIHDNKVKHNGQIWVLDNDRCSVCSCQTGRVMCRRMVCDCENPTADLFCCPECDPRLSSQCLHQNGLLTYGSGDTWVENCQQCQCLQGQVDCWPLLCPHVDCEFTVVPEGECCARCVTDPCQADTIRNNITKTCMDEHGIQRFSGSSWVKHSTECTLCQCKNGHICCSMDPMCL
ncbi:protein kinase C-binding protein NELL2 [Salmo salar]|uniref:Protein kinase C-binding protein NELL2 n=2 Tax=Salmo salar TaxID=8030 RepID=A0A1S3MM79_SALSA|nr:protein kinase C-binding protein NELL2 [Salmo salar]|eukprot:XP_014004287.1 PREDICTED: protein kinase C-binding protein NELL2 [Salmo salar]